MSVTTPAWMRGVTAPNPGPMTLQGTNTWILGIDGLVVVDPGPLDESHLLDVAMHGAIEHIFLTHGHGDHSDGAQRLHELTGAPVSAWDERHVSHGEKLTDAMTMKIAGLNIEILHAPGHTMDSVCFVVSSGSESVVLTGDTILGEGSTVIAHPEGRVDHYLRTLERLAQLDALVVLPGHGPVTGSASQRATQYLDHRHERIAQVRDAVAQGATTPEHVLEVVYSDVHDSLRGAALLSAQAHLMFVLED